jgi:hypothetical protein
MMHRPLARRPYHADRLPVKETKSRHFRSQVNRYSQKSAAPAIIIANALALALVPLFLPFWVLLLSEPQSV